MKALRKRLVSLLLVLSMLVSLVPAAFAAEEAVTTISGNVKRIAGADRIGTSLGIADQLKETLGGGQFGTVVVASALNFPDALTGSYLAAKKDAPILLTYEAADATVLQYVRENLAPGGLVYILGGYTAVSAGFEDSLKNAGITFKRLAGSDRFGTNIAIMEEAGDYAGKPVLIATAINFADSLSASAAGLPMVLVHGSLKPEQKEFLEKTSGQFVIIGGTAAVSPALENELKAFGSVERLAGNGRYQTSVMVAQKFVPNHNSVVLAYARNFPDGLCAGPLAYALGAPLILTDNYDPREADNYVTGINTGFVVGGSGLISDVATRAIFDLGNGNEKPVYTVSFLDSLTGNTIEIQMIEEGLQIPAPGESPVKEGYHFAGWYADRACTVEFDFAQPVTSDTTVYAGWLSLQDTDGDKLPDGAEVYYHTDIHNQDTDSDGLSDYIEVVILGTDPLSADSGNGTADADQDSDGDGISNADELALGTNPGDADTDADLLTDDREISLGTDPANYDTDGDGASDGAEVRLGTDPLAADASFSMTLEAETEDSVTPSVDIVLQGDQVDTLSVEPFADPKMFPEEMPGYLGQAYDFNVSGDFESADIHFTFDPSILEAGAEPTIFYFNEETQLLEELNTVIDGNVATATVEHFSTYVLIDRKVYYASFSWEDIWDTEGTFDSVEVVLVIDDSGSLGGDYTYNADTGYFEGGKDPQHLRLDAARNFVDKSSSAAKIGIVKFDSNVETFATLTECTESGKTALKNILHFTRKTSNTSGVFDSKGTTYMYSGISTAFGLFSNPAETTQSVLRAVIVFTDGDAHDASYHSSVIAQAQNLGIRIYTVGLGNSTSYFTNYLQPLAEQTGGSFYLASAADELDSIYDDINKKIDLSSDTDQDGVPDYYEDNMVAFNGMPIRMDKSKKDTDGDGLEDGKEVEIQKIPNEDGSQVRVVGKLHSYPDKTDSDNDSIHDYYDPDPMDFTITDRVLSWVEGLSYTNLASYVGKTVGYAVDHGANIINLSEPYLTYLKDAVIVAANNSGSGYWKDFWDSGLGYIALKITRRNQPTAVIFALRGTEPSSDLANDAAADLVLGVGWDSEQSRNAFRAYKQIATNKSYDYYITGHSLGGRLVQDVLYKTYNANEGGLLKEKANIITPVHSVTFNALGYNKIVYASLENDVLASYKSKLTNYYYWLDLVGEGFGHAASYTRAGKDVELLCKNISGSYYRDKEFNNWINIRDCDYHGIAYFHSDYDLLYATSDAPANKALPGSKLTHSFSYWVD